MRTTIELTEEAYLVAKDHAAEHRMSLGRAVSELILAPRGRYSAASGGVGSGTAAGLDPHHAAYSHSSRAMMVRENTRRWPSVHVDTIMTVDRAKQLLDDEPAAGGPGAGGLGAGGSGAGGHAAGGLGAGGHAAGQGGGGTGA